jgi:NAD(P)-dependent dehydrogenase (short-subunit alcohol dehydrogenase family)
MDRTPQQFLGTNVLITGASKGIGGACAQAFSRHGANVWLTDVDDAAGRMHAATLGEGVHYRHLDVTSESDWATVTAEISGHGPLHVLVNSAGAAIKAPLTGTSLD